MVARFWVSALGWSVVAEDKESREVEIADPSGRARPMLFLVVPEPKSSKNRVHMDVRASASIASEVARLEALGASVLQRVAEDGSYWTVMGDPEGNEFCVLRGPEDGQLSEADR